MSSTFDLGLRAQKQQGAGPWWQRRLCLLSGTGRGAQVHSGEKLLVLGAPGAGKRTLAALLIRAMRLPTAATGVVLVGGVDVSRVNLARLRAHVAVAWARPTLFKGSIVDNLDPCVPLERGGGARGRRGADNPRGALCAGAALLARTGCWRRSSSWGFANSRRPRSRPTAPRRSTPKSRRGPFPKAPSTDDRAIRHRPAPPARRPPTPP